MRPSPPDTTSHRVQPTSHLVQSNSARPSTWDPHRERPAAKSGGMAIRAVLGPAQPNSQHRSHTDGKRPPAYNQPRPAVWASPPSSSLSHLSSTSIPVIPCSASYSQKTLPYNHRLSAGPESLESLHPLLTCTTRFTGSHLPTNPTNPETLKWSTSSLPPSLRSSRCAPPSRHSLRTSSDPRRLS